MDDLAIFLAYYDCSDFWLFERWNLIILLEV